MSLLFPQIETKLEACGFICELENDRQVPQVSPSLSTNDEKRASQSILQTHHYDVMINNTSPNDIQEIYPYTITAEQMPSSVVDDRDLRSHRFWKDNKFYRTSVRSVSNNSYFFPTTEMYNITCGLVNMTYQCTFGSNFDVDTGVSSMQTPINRFKTIIFLDNNKVRSVIQAKDFSSWTVIEIGNGSAVMNVTCSDLYTPVSPKFFVLFFSWLL